jgi:hypothetical protein
MGNTGLVCTKLSVNFRPPVLRLRRQAREDSDFMLPSRLEVDASWGQTSWLFNTESTVIFWF